MSRAQKLHAPLNVSFSETIEAIADQGKPETQSLEAKPFFLFFWGKRSVLTELIRQVAEQYLIYREPFLGGGALFFAIQPTKAYLSDINFHLILAYQAVRDDIDRLIINLKVHERNHNKQYFQRARDRLCNETDTTKVAALFIYLNKTCFNGLYRVNKNGKFNVPIGSYVDPSIFDEEVLLNDSKMLRGVTIAQHPFWQIPVSREDFYYLDPPYHQTYSQYDGSGFGEAEHRKLAEFCHEIDGAKAYFMLSNSDTPFVRSLFSKFYIEQIAASRSVSCKADQRGKENELVIRNYK